MSEIQKIIMHYPKNFPVSARIDVFEWNFTKFSWVMLWKHPQKNNLWMVCSSCYTILQI